MIHWSSKHFSDFFFWKIESVLLILSNLPNIMIEHGKSNKIIFIDLLKMIESQNNMRINIKGMISNRLIIMLGLCQRRKEDWKHFRLINQSNQPKRVSLRKGFYEFLIDSFFRDRGEECVVSLDRFSSLGFKVKKSDFVFRIRFFFFSSELKQFFIDHVHKS